MKQGQHFILNMPDDSCHGMLVEFIKQNNRTGDCSVKLLEDRPHPDGGMGWTKGTVLQVFPEQLQSVLSDT